MQSPLFDDKVQSLVAALKLQLAEHKITLRELAVDCDGISLRGVVVQGVRVKDLYVPKRVVNTKVSDTELKVLNELAEHYHDEEANCLYTRFIASETKLEFKQARRAVRALVRKGLAVYERGLFDYDGMVAGSGYRASFEGALLVKGCQNKATCGNLADMVTGECQECWEKRRVYAFTDDWGDYKKGDTVTKEQLGDGDIFKTLYWGTYENEYKDKRLVDATPTPAWCCQECGNKDCVC